MSKALDSFFPHHKVLNDYQMHCWTIMASTLNKDFKAHLLCMLVDDNFELCDNCGTPITSNHKYCYTCMDKNK